MAPFPFSSGLRIKRSRKKSHPRNLPREEVNFVSLWRQIRLKDSWKKILTTPNFSPNLRQNLELGGLGSRFQKESGNGRGEWKECHIDLLRIGDGLKKLKKLLTHKLTKFKKSEKKP